MKRSIILIAATTTAVAAVFAGTAAASSTRIAVRAGGTVRAFSTTGPKATFLVALRKGPGNKITYREPGMSFRSLSISTTLFGRNDAKFTGTGLANGRRVHYTAILVSHPTARGVFRIGWNHAAARGGALLSGAIRLTPKRIRTAQSIATGAGLVRRAR